MGKFYGVKIRNGEINPRTGAAWVLEDVPKLWRKVTEKWLANKLLKMPEERQKGDGNDQ